MFDGDLPRILLISALIIGGAVALALLWRILPRSRTVHGKTVYYPPRQPDAPRPHAVFANAIRFRPVDTDPTLPNAAVIIESYPIGGAILSLLTFNRPSDLYQASEGRTVEPSTVLRLLSEGRALRLTTQQHSALLRGDTSFLAGPPLNAANVEAQVQRALESMESQVQRMAHTWESSVDRAFARVNSGVVNVATTAVGTGIGGGAGGSSGAFFGGGGGASGWPQQWSTEGFASGTSRDATAAVAGPFRPKKKAEKPQPEAQKEPKSRIDQLLDGDDI